MSDWATTKEQWTAWTREPLAMPPRHDGFGAVDDELTQRLAHGGFLGGLEETTVSGTAAEPLESQETKVRAAPAAAAAFDLDDEVEGAAPTSGADADAEAAETMIRGVVPTSELEVGLEAPQGELEVGLVGAPAPDSTPEGQTETTQPEGLFIPSLTRPAEPAETPAVAPPTAPPPAAPPAAATPPVAPPVAPSPVPARSGATVVARNPLHEAGQDGAPPVSPGKTVVPTTAPAAPASPEAAPPVQPTPAVTGSTLPPGVVQADSAPPAPPPSASGVTGDTLPPTAQPSDAEQRSPAASSRGDIVMGGGSAEESMTAGIIGGGIDDAPEPAPAPPVRQKVVIGAPVPTREDVTAEIDATDIFDHEDVDDDDYEDVDENPDHGSLASDAAVVPRGEGLEEMAAEVVEEVPDETQAAAAPSAEPVAGADVHDLESTQRLPGTVEPPAPPKPPEAPKPPPAPVRAEASAAPTAQPNAPEVAPRAPDSAAQPSASRQPGWPQEVFTEAFAALTRDNHPSSAKGEVEFFVKSTNIQPGARVLDVGCGDGAHALVLSQQGFDVTGVDLSAAQLDRAERARSALGATATFVRGDMRELPVEGPFGAILCIGTTFGYYDDEENRAVLRRLASLLAPGGRLLLQVFNRDHMISRLPARSWWQGRGCLVLDEAQMNYFNNRLAVHRTAVFEDGQQFEHNIQIRTYNAHELGRMCVDAGLRVVQISGSRLTPGRFYGSSSADIWLTVEPKT